MTLMHWQLAADGKWEECFILSPHPSEEEKTKLAHWVSSVSGDVAIECFFQNKQSEICFFGIRIKSLPLEQKIIFLNELFQKTARKDDCPSLLEALCDILQKQSIFSITPDFLEIGAEGFWKSYGFLRVWDKTKPESIASLKDIGMNAPQLLQPFKRPIMLEFGWSAPHPHWIGIQISNRTGNHYQFSETRYTLLGNPDNFKLSGMER